MNMVKKALLPTEAKVVELKYSAVRFGKMNDEQRYLSALSIIAKISIITGWEVPRNETAMLQLIQQLDFKLQESYQYVNQNEIEYAFRNNLEVKDYGKNLNLALIDEVMRGYLQTRFDISKQEERISNQVLMLEDQSKMSDEEWEEWVGSIRVYEFEKIPNYLYGYYERKGAIKLSVDEKHNFMEKAIGYVTAKLEGKDLYDFKEMKREGKFSGDMLAKIKTIAKKFAVKHYFNQTSNNE